MAVRISADPFSVLHLFEVLDYTAYQFANTNVKALNDILSTPAGANVAVIHVERGAIRVSEKSATDPDFGASPPRGVLYSSGDTVRLSSYEFGAPPPTPGGQTFVSSEQISFSGNQVTNFATNNYLEVDSRLLRIRTMFTDGSIDSSVQADSSFRWRKKLWGFIKRCSLAFDDYAGITINLADTTVMEGVRYDEDPGDEPSVVGSTGSSHGGGRWLLPFLEGVLYEHAWIFPGNADGYVPGQRPNYTALSRWEQRVKSASQFGRRGQPLKVIYMSHTPWGPSDSTDAERAAFRDQTFAYNMASVLMAASYGLKNVYWAVSNTDNGNQELSYHYPVERYMDGSTAKGWRLGHPKAPWYWHDRRLDPNTGAMTSGLAVAWYENGIVLVNPPTNATPDPNQFFSFTVPRACADVLDPFTAIASATSVRVYNGRALLLVFR